MNSTCIQDCPPHGRMCDLDADHTDDHECVDCPGQQQARWRAAINARVAAHRAAEMVETTPDVD